ncbi:sulfatase-like hydrolase/transferase [Echinicola sp. CAU 1574]|uniref:Sulfatase-like hydrolase/transferase n=1 Tax=Echinicola arenosa TaxID=2774144 RepID=A0ABR9AQ74_9BACT|nr:sulfatase-like hydrolase/transferase [Echinicola arenosa]MBD8490935.1 sulfatase-like hydrolase/transferase [Echinicola arenosa]
MTKLNKLVAAAFMVLLTGPKVSVAQEQKQPNIIFILTDDLGYGDLGVFFQNSRKDKGDRSEPWILTPELDRMAAEGAMLTNHYTAAPVCAPSRASILMGVNQGHAHVRDNQFDKYLGDNYTVAEVLKSVGYETVAIGKWGLQGGGEGPDWPSHPLKKGFDHYFGYIRHRDGHEHYPVEGVYRGAKEVYEDYKIVQGLDKCYTGDLFTAKAKKYIVDHQERRGDQPFFMFLSYDTPHAVLELPTQDYPAGGGLKGGMQWIGTPGNMINTASGEVDSFIYPEFASATYDDDKDETTPEKPWPDTYKRYASVNRRIDDQVGDILQLLKDLEIDENTLVVFTSDNGPSRESYLPKEYVDYTPEFFNNFAEFDGIKRDVYEGGLRTATIVHWPGSIKENTVVDEPSISYDWLPTFADAAGTAAPVRSDGVSLLPSLTGKGKQKESQIYVEYFQNGNVPRYAEFTEEHQGKKRGQMQMIRKGNMVGVRYNITDQTDDFEIYDVTADPQQAQNIAASQSAMQAEFKQMVLRRRIADPEAKRPYDEALVPALEVMKVRSGLLLNTYLVNTDYIPQVVGKTKASEKVVSISDSGLSDKGNLAVFEGYIEVPESGEYRFSTSKTEQKVYMRIHDIGVLDGNYHNQDQPEGKVFLEKGLHPIKFYYLNKEGKKSASVKLNWSRANQSDQEVPNSAFFR